MTFRAISYGGGVQSTALIVLAAEGRIEADVALFSNVGDDSENPKTLAYVRDVAIPWATDRGLPLEVVRKLRRDGTPDTVKQSVLRRQRSVPIPVRMGDTGAPGTRPCSIEFKVKVVDRWLTGRGYGPDNKADVLIGFSTDEIGRASNGRDMPASVRRFPLLDLGVSRAECENIIRRAGLPVPPKSACYFCPYHRAQTWAEMRRDEPDLFDQAAELEQVVIDRRVRIGRDPVYFTKFGRPLRAAIPAAQHALFDVHADYGSDIGEDGCDEGTCFV